jgi:hypothetical protein
MLTSLVSWVEQGTAPDRIIASGANFSSPPAARSRPLCPYPQEARYTGPAGGDLSVASNYTCIKPANFHEGRRHDHDRHFGRNDHDQRFARDDDGRH